MASGASSRLAISDRVAPHLAATRPQARRQRSSARVGGSFGLAVHVQAVRLSFDRAGDQPPAWRHALGHRPPPLQSAGAALARVGDHRRSPERAGGPLDPAAGGRAGTLPIGSCRPALGTDRRLRPDRHHPAIRPAPAPAHPVHRSAHASYRHRRLVGRCRPLAAAADQPAAPRIAVMLGGHVGPWTFDSTKGRELGRQANALAGTAGGSLLVSTSARTPPDVVEAFAAELRVPHRLYRWRPDDWKIPISASLPWPTGSSSPATACRCWWRPPLRANR